MGVKTFITALTADDAHRESQLSALAQALMSRAAYAFSTVQTYLRITPAGHLHLCVLGMTEQPGAHPLLGNPDRTVAYARVPDECDPSAVPKSPRRLVALYDQLRFAYLCGLTGEVRLTWRRPDQRPPRLTEPAALQVEPMADEVLDALLASLVAEPRLPAVRLEKA